MSANKHEIHNGVSTADEPSAAWGWHDLGRKPVIKGAIGGAFFMLLMLIGNHVGNVENVFLVVFAVVLLAGALLVALQPKLTQMRTVTAHNQPEGYQERDWPADQLNLEGAYANLNDTQLRSLNIDPATVDRSQRTIEG